MTEEKQYIVVVGGVNIDIGGHSYAPLIEKDSNPGTIRMSLGGVGRNIAHNLRLLGSKVRFLTAFGDDAFSQQIEASCAMLGIDIRHAQQVKGAASSTYLYINDAGGDMALAMSDMAVCEHITADFLASKQKVIDEAALLVADTNIPEEALEYLAFHSPAPLFVDAVSVTKAKKLRPILGRLHTLKANRLEAEILSGMEITDLASCEQAAQGMLQTGLKRVFITLGPEGAFVAEPGKSTYIPRCNANVRNVTGGGDAFMAALAKGYLQDLSMEEAGRMAAVTAAIAIEGDETINPKLSMKAVEERMMENQYSSGGK